MTKRKENPEGFLEGIYGYNILYPNKSIKPTLTNEEWANNILYGFYNYTSGNMEIYYEDNPPPQKTLRYIKTHDYTSNCDSIKESLKKGDSSVLLKIIDLEGDFTENIFFLLNKLNNGQNLIIEDITNIYKEVNKISFKDAVIISYLLIEYNQEIITSFITNTNYKKSVPSYLANRFCLINDFDNLQKITIKFKNNININCEKHYGRKNTYTSLKHAILNLNKSEPEITKEIIKYLIKQYNDISISIENILTRVNQLPNLTKILENNEDISTLMSNYIHNYKSNEFIANITNDTIIETISKCKNILNKPQNVDYYNKIQHILNTPNCKEAFIDFIKKTDCIFPISSNYPENTERLCNIVILSYLLLKHFKILPNELQINDSLHTQAFNYLANIFSKDGDLDNLKKISTEHTTINISSTKAFNKSFPTCLWQAINNNHSDIVEYLLTGPYRKSINPSKHHDTKTLNPQELAKKKGDQTIIDLINNFIESKNDSSEDTNMTNDLPIVRKKTRGPYIKKKKALLEYTEDSYMKADSIKNTNENSVEKEIDNILKAFTRDRDYDPIITNYNDRDDIFSLDDEVDYEVLEVLARDDYITYDDDITYDNVIRIDKFSSFFDKYLPKDT